MTEESNIFSGSSQLTLPADRKEFPALQQWILNIAAELDIPERIRKQLMICCDEVFTNIASYAYPEGNGSVAVAGEFVSETRS